MDFKKSVVSQSSGYDNSKYPAENAFIGKFTHTHQGVGQWWKADFEGGAEHFTKIRIRNRDGSGQRLAKTKVFISEQLCGQLPDKTEDGDWYTIRCSLKGNEVKLVTVQNTYLSIQGIEAFVLDPTCFTAKEQDCSLSSVVKFDQNKVSQSSGYDHNKYPATNAFKPGKFTHTNQGVGQWWMGKFSKKHNFTKVRILNRDGMGHRLRLSEVRISGKLCGSITSDPQNGKWYELDCKLTGDEIKIVTTQNTNLSIEGIEAYATPTNCNSKLEGKPKKGCSEVLSKIKITDSMVSQKSTLSGDFAASNALINKFSHTNKGIGQWWQAKFPEVNRIKKISIKNRSDCCGERLSEVKVFVGEKLCGSLPKETKTGQWYHIECNHSADFIKLVATKDTYLSIQGIEVLGVKKTIQKLKIEKDMVSMSKPYDHNKYPASNALINEFTHTIKGAGMWYKATFAEDHSFTKIRIKNRVNCCGDRLSQVKVYISGKLCGTLPKDTKKGQWYDVKCNLIGKEIKLVMIHNNYLSIQGIEAYAGMKSDPHCGNRPTEIVEHLGLPYTPFAITPKDIPVEKVQSPIHTATCKKTGIFGMKGKCYGGDAAKKWLANLDMPGDNAFIQDIWDDYIAPLVMKMPTNILPAGCLGDFSTNVLKTDPASKMAKCANFPLAKDQKISAIGFAVKLPCPTVTPVEICAIFDKCGTFGVSMSGGVIGCTVAATGIGAILSPVASSMKYIQFGYSPNRMWESKLELLDPDNMMAKKIVNLRSHIYMGAQFKIPKVGISFSGVDVTDLFAFKIAGQAFVDFGNKNDLTPENIVKLIKDKSISAPDKFVTLVTAAREYSFQARGSFSLALGKLTKQIIPDIKLIDEMDVNLLINLGAGIDGDKGSSGMQAGIHVFVKPPPLNIIGVFINSLVNTVTKVLKVGTFPIPKLPTLSGVEMGFTIGSKLGFKLQLGKIFSIACVLKTEGGFALSCKLGLDFLTLFIEAGKWIAKMGKKLFDAAGKAFMSVVSSIGDFAKDIAVGAKKIFEGLKNAAKAAYEVAKKVYHKLKENAKKLLAVAKVVHDKVKKVFDKVGQDIKNAFEDIGRKLDKFISQLGRDIAALAAKIWNSLFNRSKYERNKRAKEKARDELLASKHKARLAAQEKAEKEAESSEKEENFANVEAENAVNEEIVSHKTKWMKKLEYENQAKKLTDL